jgi:hypothetical protein
MIDKENNFLKISSLDSFDENLCSNNRNKTNKIVEIKFVN